MKYLYENNDKKNNNNKTDSIIKWPFIDKIKLSEKAIKKRKKRQQFIKLKTVQSCPRHRWKAPKRLHFHVKPGE